MATSTSRVLVDGITFDDVLLRPGFSDFKRQDINTSSLFTKKIPMRSPFVSAPMDTVTEGGLALAVAGAGGVGIIHRNLSPTDQADHVASVKRVGHIVAAAIGAEGFDDRVDMLIRAGVDALLIDSAHGYAKTVIEALIFLKKTHPNIQVIAGNIATKEAAQALVDAGADALRVGMGPGAICTTRVVSGMGVPQMTALFEVCPVARRRRVPVIADGGIVHSGDMVKALAAGASSVMMGGLFASCEEAPGEKISLKKAQVPLRFKDILRIDQEEYLFKSYRGMGSMGAMKRGAQIKSEGEFHGKSYADRVLVAEGVEGLVPVRGSVRDLLDQAIGGIKSGMYYVGAQNISELHHIATFIRISHASLKESHPHSILITNPGKNYSPL